jgi:hypothetical protein
MKRTSLEDWSNVQEKYEYEKIKQDLFVKELSRYRVQTIYIEKYGDLTLLLSEIERRYNSHSVFISGSAAEYGDFTEREAQNFIHLISSELVKNKLTVINGFGLGVGSAVINGALDAVYSNPKKYSENQLVVKPFPQFPSGGKNLKELWEEYRQNMISRAGIILFLFGNKKIEDGSIENAGGVKREFDIAISKGLLPVPIYYTGYKSTEIFEEMKKMGFQKELIDDISKLQLQKDDIQNSVNQIIELIKKLIR